MLAIENAKQLAEAGAQSAKQCLSLRIALRQARQDEQVAREKEATRLQKLKTAREEKQRKDDEKAAKKEQAQLAKMEEKRRKAEEKQKATAEAENPDDEQKTRQRRRGRGVDELIEGTDAPCLVNRFPSVEVPVCKDSEEFVTLMLQGLPVTWRAKRPPFKRILESSGFSEDSKVLANAATVIQSEWKAFMSSFAEEVQSNPELKKRNRSCSSEVQAFREALSLDMLADRLRESYLEEESADLGQCTVMEEGVIKEFLDKFNEEKKATLSEDDARKMLNEINMYRTLHLVGMPQGKGFAGTFGGLFPHLVYQMEGVKAISLVRAADVALDVFNHSFSFQLSVTYQLLFFHNE